MSRRAPPPPRLFAPSGRARRPKPAAPALAALTLALAASACVASEDALFPTHTVERTLTGDALAAEYAVEGEHYVSPVTELEAPATRFAAMLTLASADGARALRLEARAVDGDAAGAWVPVETTFVEDELRVVRAELGAPTRAVQLRVPVAAARDLALMTWTAVVPAVEEDDAEVEGATATARSGLAADLAASGILPRSAWGARPARCSRPDGAKERMAIHHTVSARTSGGTHEAMLRQTQAFHMDGRGYCDVGYHFFVTADGRAWEARAVDAVGGHSGNYNGRNAGIVFVGCFDAASVCGNLGGRDVPDAMIAAGARVVRALSQRYGISIDGDRVRGHGEQPFQATACPGSHLRPRLEELRSRARSGGGGNPPVANPPVANPPAPVTPPPAASAPCGAVSPNVALVPGGAVRSCGGRFLLVHQGDGNVVLYDEPRGRALWSTQTHGRATASFVMQGDGNLVLYAPGGRPLWSSGTHGRPGAWLAVQDDGNVVVYLGTRPLWATNTVQR
jgi:hypothetical protein